MILSKSIINLSKSMMASLELKRKLIWIKFHKQICLGEGANSLDARERAATAGLKLIESLDLQNVLPKQSEKPEEQAEVKMEKNDDDGLLEIKM